MSALFQCQGIGSQLVTLIEDEGHISLFVTTNTEAVAFHLAKDQLEPFKKALTALSGTRLVGAVPSSDEYIANAKLRFHQSLNLGFKAVQMIATVKEVWSRRALDDPFEYLYTEYKIRFVYDNGLTTLEVTEINLAEIELQALIAAL